VEHRSFRYFFLLALLSQWDPFLFGGYKNFSMEYVLQQHPEWSSNMTHVEEVAAQQFEASGKDFYLTTINTIKKARPNAKVAFYSTPFKGWHSYFDPVSLQSPSLHTMFRHTLKRRMPRSVLVAATTSPGP